MTITAATALQNVPGSRTEPRGTNGEAQVRHLLRSRGQGGDEHQMYDLSTTG